MYTLPIYNDIIKNNAGSHAKSETLRANIYGADLSMLNARGLKRKVLLIIMKKKKKDEKEWFQNFLSRLLKFEIQLGRFGMKTILVG